MLKKANQLKLYYIISLIITLIVIISFISITEAKADELAKTEKEIEEFRTDKCLYAGITKDMANMLPSIKMIPEETIVNEVSSPKPEEIIEKEEPKDIITKYISVTKANIRSDKNTDSEILGTINWNEEINGYVDDEWFKLSDIEGYIKLDLLSDDNADYVDKAATIRTNVKCYMPMSAITCKSSPQYKIRANYAYTGNYGISQVNGRYCVALASYYGVSIGQYFDIILENGNVIPCIKGDAKADCDTDPATHSYTKYNNCMTEFIIGSTSILNQYIHGGGNLSSIDEFDSPVKTIRVYEKSCFE